MATSPGILNGSALAAGLLSDFQNTYDQDFDNVQAGLSLVMDMERQSATRTTTYAYRETPPYPKRRPRGNPVDFGVMKSVSFSVTAYNYARGLAWNRDDRMDNQIGDLAADAQALGSNFASLPSSVFIEFLTGTASLLPAVPNAPDGVALFSALNGDGNNRFGVSGGNIYTGTGTTPTPVRADIFGAIERMTTFQNTEGKPFFPPRADMPEHAIWFSATNQDVMAEALRADIVHSVQQSTGAGVTNLIIAGGLKLSLFPTAEITDNDIFIARGDVPVKPLFMTTREPLRSVIATEDNSDDARKTGVESVQFEWRGAFGANVPFGFIKVNN